MASHLPDARQHAEPKADDRGSGDASEPDARFTVANERTFLGAEGPRTPGRSPGLRDDRGPATAPERRGTGTDTVYFCSAHCAAAFDADPQACTARSRGPCGTDAVQRTEPGFRSSPLADSAGSPLYPVPI